MAHFVDLVRFEGELCVASTGAVPPNRDIDGRQLQVLHDTAANHQQALLYGVVATDTGGAVDARRPELNETRTCRDIIPPSRSAQWRKRLLI